MTQRKFKGSDVAMLSACEVIANHALNNIDAIQAVNSAWNEAYFSNISDSIKDILTNYFGLNSGTELKSVTDDLLKQQTEMLWHLTMLNSQIDVAYKADPAQRKQILSILGYTAWWDKAKRSKNQIALVALLEVFAKGCTKELQDKLIARKISDVSIQYILDNSSSVYQLNVRQEGLKDSRKFITVDLVNRFNDIYDQTMLYSRSLQTLFNGDPLRKKIFSYTHILQLLSPSHRQDKTVISDGDSSNE